MWPSTAALLARSGSRIGDRLDTTLIMVPGETTDTGTPLKQDHLLPTST